MKTFCILSKALLKSRNVKTQNFDVGYLMNVVRAGSISKVNHIDYADKLFHWLINVGYFDIQRIPNVVLVQIFSISSHQKYPTLIQPYELHSFARMMLP